jgi:hypothetical protein
VIHEVLVDAVQAQPSEVVTVADPLAPANGACIVVGDTVNAHEAAFCVTVNVCPAMVAVPTRTCVVVFVFALRETVPLPEPLAPLVIVSQAVALLTAVHAHPGAVVTSVVVLAPAEPTALLVGVNE